MNVRGIRGAIDVPANDTDNILEATKELLQDIMQKNSIIKEQIVAIYFSMTKDLNAVYPAKAARKMGWKYIPLFCVNEMDVPGSLSRCIRILMLINSVKKQDEIKHVYLRGAAMLRKDLQVCNEQHIY